MNRKSSTSFSGCAVTGVFVLLILIMGVVFGNVVPIVASGNQAGNVVKDGNDSSAIVNYTIWIDDWKKEVNIDAWGTISVADYYLITNKLATNTNNVTLILPLNAVDIAVEDPFGKLSSDRLTKTTSGGYIQLRVYLRETLQPELNIRLLATYELPKATYLMQQGWLDYTLNVSIGKPYYWLVKQLSVIVFLPEGAEFQGTSKQPFEALKDGFSTKVVFSEVNVTEFSESSFTVQYTYIILWAAFRPALWIGTGVVIVAILIFFRRMTRFPSVVGAPMIFSPEILRDFVNKYEERKRLKSELDSLESEVRKGKLSRRRHRLRKSSIDGRLSRLEKDLANLKAQLSSAGGRYSERMKHLETAEAEIETLNTDIERAEVRFQHKEISAETRRRLLDEYNRIKERAENTIAETILRLREEIH